MTHVASQYRTHKPNFCHLLRPCKGSLSQFWPAPEVPCKLPAKVAFGHQSAVFPQILPQFASCWVYPSNCMGLSIWQSQNVVNIMDCLPTVLEDWCTHFFFFFWMLCCLGGPWRPFIILTFVHFLISLTSRRFVSYPRCHHQVLV